MRDDHQELATLVDWIEQNDGSLTCKAGLWCVEIGGLTWQLVGSKLTEDACRRAREGITSVALAKARERIAEERNPPANDDMKAWNRWLSNAGPRPSGLAPDWVIADTRYNDAYCRGIK